MLQWVQTWRAGGQVEASMWRASFDSISIDCAWALADHIDHTGSACQERADKLLGNKLAHVSQQTQLPLALDLWNLLLRLFPTIQVGSLNDCSHTVCILFFVL